MRWIYWFGWNLFGSAYRSLFGLKVVGREHLVTEGAVLIASNHESFLDPPLIGTLYRDEMFSQRGELFPSSSFAPLGLRLAIEEASGRWGVALIGRNVTHDVSADFAGPTPDPTQPPSALPAALRSVLVSGWFRR